MKLVVFGANGGTGAHVVEQALAAGHLVTAVARRPEVITQTHRNLSVMQGDVLKPDTLSQALNGQEAVISVLGVTNGSPATLHSEGITNIIRAMQSAGVRRLIALSAGGLEPGPLIQRLIAKPLLWYFFGEHYADLVRMEDAVKKSGLDWTIMRPPRLMDTPHTGRYKEAINIHLTSGWQISRADLADAILKHMNNPATYCATVEVAS
jgi:putative NADH-flavin reductase